MNVNAPPSLAMQRFIDELNALDEKERRKRLPEIRQQARLADPARTEMRRRAFEAMIDALRADADTTWIPEFGPLDRFERQKVTKDARAYLALDSAYREKPTD